LFVTICMILVGACGSSAKSGHGSTTPTTVAAARLDLSPTAGAATPSAAVGAPAIDPVRPTKYVLDTRLADLGARGLVWRMNAHAVNVRDVQRFAAVLGLGGSPTRTSSGLVVQDTNAILNLFVSNGTVYVSYAFGVPSAVGGSIGSSGAGVVTPGPVTSPATRAEPPVPSPGPATQLSPPVTATGPILVPVAPRVVPPVEVPNAARAESIARGLLDRLGVLNGQQWSTDVSDSRSVAVSCASGMACPTVPPDVFARTVVFSLTLEGATVDGVTWSVTIGEHGRIASLNGEWATPVQLGSYPLRATTAAFADLQYGDAPYPGPQPMTAIAGGVEAPAIGTSPTAPTIDVHITGVTLGIARWDAYLHGTSVVDLVPTYRFHANIDGETSYDVELLALRPNDITFTNPVPTREPLGVQPAPPPVVIPGSPPSPTPNMPSAG
jgi:hypothetical protein